MPDVIADDFERDVGVDEALHTGVAERVRPRPPHRDPGPVQIGPDALGDGRGS